MCHKKSKAHRRKQSNPSPDHIHGGARGPPEKGPRLEAYGINHELPRSQDIETKILVPRKSPALSAYPNCTEVEKPASENIRLHASSAGCSGPRNARVREILGHQTGHQNHAGTGGLRGHRGEVAERPALVSAKLRRPPKGGCAGADELRPGVPGRRRRHCR